MLSLVANRITWLTRWDRMSMADARWLLKEGGEKEPRKVVDQFLRWIRGQEVVCYRTAYDFQRGFAKIRIPMAIIFGDMDPLASLASTRLGLPRRQERVPAVAPGEGHRPHSARRWGTTFGQIVMTSRTSSSTRARTGPARPRCRASATTCGLLRIGRPMGWPKTGAASRGCYGATL